MISGESGILSLCAFVYRSAAESATYSDLKPICTVMLLKSSSISAMNILKNKYQIVLKLSEYLLSPTKRDFFELCIGL